jgi:tRNA (guanine-N7-)-methyltransferase
MAKANPDINYMGIELYDSVIVSALENALEAGTLPNLKLLKVNGAHLAKFFEKNDVSRVYLNFSDPGQKRDMRKKDYLQELLKLYESILVDNGKYISKQTIWTLNSR